MGRGLSMAILYASRAKYRFYLPCMGSNVCHNTWPIYRYVFSNLNAELSINVSTDTMGYAFTFPLVSLICRIPVGAYVHYPTISTDMLARVRSRKKWHTNTSVVSSSAVLSKIKLLWGSRISLVVVSVVCLTLVTFRYYRIFMYYYASSLRTASFLMVNSSWTKNHIDSILQHHDTLLDTLHLWPPIVLFNFLNSWISPKKSERITSARIVYPPCDTREMSIFPLDNREHVILSVAQFRLVFKACQQSSSINACKLDPRRITLRNSKRLLSCCVDTLNTWSGMVLKIQSNLSWLAEVEMREMHDALLSCVN